MAGKRERSLTMTCRKYDRWVAEYALGECAELTDAQKSELRQHLAACPACAESLRRASELVSSLRAGLKWAPPEELLRDTHRNVMQSVAEIERKKVARRESPLWYAAAS